MKELLLNEKSLDGQFGSMDEFYKTLPVMGQNLRILKNNDVVLQKHSTLYQQKITGEITLYDLQNRKGKVEPTQRDKLILWKRQLSSLMNTPPFWDLETADSKDSIEEAARRGTDVLSFLHDGYKDTILKVPCEDGKCDVRSSVSTGYLVDGLYQRGFLSRLEYIRQRFLDGRIRMTYIDTEIAGIDVLEKREMEELLEGLERFEAARTWKDIMEDRFFDYKSYQPSSSKYDVFAKGDFSDKNIDKFRCGQHSQIRCFGYREGEQFFVLRIERDHRYSDHG